MVCHFMLCKKTLFSYNSLILMTQPYSLIKILNRHARTAVVYCRKLDKNVTVYNRNSPVFIGIKAVAILVSPDTTKNKPIDGRRPHLQIITNDNKLLITKGPLSRRTFSLETVVNATSRNLSAGDHFIFKTSSPPMWILL